MAKQLNCFCLKWSTTDAENYFTVVGEEVNNRVEANSVERLGLEPVCANRGVVLRVWGSYKTPSLSSCLSCPYRSFYISRLYKDNLLNRGGTQSKE